MKDVYFFDLSNLCDDSSQKNLWVNLFLLKSATTKIVVQTLLFTYWCYQRYTVRKSSFKTRGHLYTVDRSGSAPFDKEKNICLILVL